MPIRFCNYRFCPICGKRCICIRRLRDTNSMFPGTITDKKEPCIPEEEVCFDGYAQCINECENCNECEECIEDECNIFEDENDILCQDLLCCKEEEKNTATLNCEEISKISAVSDFIIEKFENAFKSIIEYKQKKQNPEETGLHGRGLYFYRQWWERNNADILVNGDLISGVPIFTDNNTLRVVNEKYSYFIPLEKIDYIRTDDGTNTCHL